MSGGRPKKKFKQSSNIEISPKGSNPEKKAAFFWTLSKSGLDPPPPPCFGHLWGNFRLSRLRKKHTTKNYLKRT